MSATSKYLSILSTSLYQKKSETNPIFKRIRKASSLDIAKISQNTSVHEPLKLSKFFWSASYILMSQSKEPSS